MDDVVALFKTILAKSAEVKASDLHLCVGTPWKFRLNGRMVAIKNVDPLKMNEAESLVSHILESVGNFSREKIETAPTWLRDLDCAYSVPGVSRFRVNICKQRGSFSIVLRVVPFSVPTVESLKLPAVIEKIALAERGLILVTGVTGSGKSTTLAAMVNAINQTKPCKIVAIEDPIEYYHKEIKASVLQREVGYDTESFSTALRAALRQDPDVILVGEMRDTDTIDIALKAAETGHLVLSTLHTTDAPKTIHRIISAFDLSEQQAVRLRLADCLCAITSQRLIRCKEDKERVAVLEILLNTPIIRECIENPSKTAGIRDFMATGREQYGMQTFDQHLMEFYQQGIIDLETAKSAATSASDFERNINFGSGFENETFN